VSVEVTVILSKEVAVLGFLVANSSQVTDHLGTQFNREEVVEHGVVLADKAETLLFERVLGLLADADQHILELLLGGV